MVEAIYGKVTNQASMVSFIQEVHLDKIFFSKITSITYKTSFYFVFHAMYDCY